MGLKIWAYVALATILLAGMKWGHGAIYDAGWNAAVTSQEAEIEAVREEIREEEKVKWTAIVDAAEGTIVIEERIVERVRVVEKEVPKIIEKIVTVHPECSSLPELAGLFSSQARASRGGTDGSAGVATEPD